MCKGVCYCRGRQSLLSAIFLMIVIILRVICTHGPHQGVQNLNGKKVLMAINQQFRLHQANPESITKKGYLQPDATKGIPINGDLLMRILFQICGRANPGQLLLQVEGVCKSLNVRHKIR